MKIKKRAAGRILAYVLSICMILGSIQWQPVSAKAETGTGTSSIELDISNCTENVGTDTYEIRVSVPSDYNSPKKLYEAGYTTLEIGYKVDSYEGGTYPGVQAFVTFGEVWDSGSWTNLVATSNSGTLTFDFSKSEKFDKTSEDTVTFGIQAANLKSGESTVMSITSARLLRTSSSSGDSGDSGSAGSGSETLDEIGTTSTYVTASYVSGTGANQSDGYYEYDLTIKNNSTTSIEDWIAVADVSGTVTNVQNHPDWSALNTAYSDGKLYFYPNVSKKSASIGANSAEVYSKTQYNGSGASLTNITVYYSSTSGTFSSFFSELSPSSGGTGDSTSEIVTDIEYNYAKLLQESLYLYDANMCGSDVGEKSEFSWRDDCHTEDAQATYNGKTIDVSGGYHDAGDHAKFGITQAYAATVLGVAHYNYKKAFSDTATEAHYKRIVDRFVEYFENCTVLDEDGSVEAFCYQVGDGDTDHSYWGAPETQTSREGQVWFTSDEDTCTDIVSETAAALAIYYLNYPETSEGKKALSYAEKLFTYAKDKTKKTGTTTPSNIYSGSSWEDDYSLAAIFLYKATNNDSYKAVYEGINLGDPNWVLSWDSVAPLVFLYNGTSSNLSLFNQNQIKQISENTRSNDNGYFLRNSWGSARYNVAHQFSGLLYDDMYDANDYTDWAQGQMHYLLGNNAGNHCFVIGYNELTVKHPHHRAGSGFSGWNFGNSDDHKHLLVGAMVGGPMSSSASYKDSTNDGESYIETEVALDYNAGLVGAAAGLYLYIMENGTDDEKAVQETVSVDDIISEHRTVSDSADSDTKGLSCKVSKVTFDKVEYGYSSAKKVVEVTNDGTESITDVEASLKSGKNFTAEVDTATIGTSGLQTGETAKINVSLKTGLPVGTYTDTLTVSSGNGSVTVELSATVEKAESTVKVTLSKKSVAVDSITVSATPSEDVEYAISNTEVTDADALKWQDEPVFTDLVEYTTYYIYARSKDSDNYKAGDISDALVVKTVVSDPYIIDLSKLGDSDYVAGLVNEDKKATISMSEDGKTVTLTDAKKYTIVGANENIVVNTGSATGVKLDGLTAESLIVNSDSEEFVIDVSGDNLIGANETKSGIVVNNSGSADQTLKITGEASATLKVVSGETAIETDGNVVVDSISLSVDGSFTGIDAAGSVTIAGGKTDVVSEGTSAGVKAGKTLTVSDGEITVNSKGGTLGIDIKGNMDVTGGTLKVVSEGDGISISGDMSVTGGLVDVDAVGNGIVAAGNVSIADGTVKVKSSNGKGIVSDKKVDISGGSTTVDSKDIVISGSDIVISGGTVSASSSDLASGDSVITADNSISLIGGTVSAKNNGTQQEGSFAFGVKSETGSIVLDGAAVDSDVTYSKDPVDKDGQAVFTCEVQFVDENGDKIDSLNVKKGSTLDFSSTKVKTKDEIDYASSKTGYSLSWIDENGKSYSGDDVYGEVNNDITFTAKWEWVLRDIAEDAEITFASTGTDKYSVVYSGKENTPEIVVKIDGEVLVADTDYTVAYSSNTEVGTANVTVKGLTKYTGEKTITFTITEDESGDNNGDNNGGGTGDNNGGGTGDNNGGGTGDNNGGGTGDNNGGGTGDNNGGGTGDNNGGGTGDNNGGGTGDNNGGGNGNDNGGGTGGNSGTSGDNGGNKGNTGKGNTNTNNSGKTAISTAKVVYNAEAEYTGKAVTPSVSVVVGSKTLTVNKDYTIAYKNNINIGEGSIVISGKNTYTGTVTKTFKIVVNKDKVYQSGDYRYKISNESTDGSGTVTLISAVNKNVKKVVIPATVNIGGKSFKVTAIGAKAFKGSTKMTSLSIGKNVTTIGSKAFFGCKKLKTVKSLGKVKTIGKSAFAKCTKLKSITIPATTVSVGSKAFYGCKSLKKIVVKSKKLTAKKLGAKAFSGTNKKATVKVPASKLKSYKKLLVKKGVSRNAVIKK